MSSLLIRVLYFLLGFVVSSTLHAAELHLLGVEPYSAEYSLVNVEHMDIEYFKYHHQFRDPYFVDGDGNYIQMRDGAALNFTLGIRDTFYWKNRVHMDNDQRTSTPKHVGWEWEAGLHLPKVPVDVFQHHHSRHGLEYDNPNGLRFPVEDTYGIRYTLIGDK